MAGDEIEEIDPLYDLAPGEFTAERNALAKRLRADGRRDEAAEVARLRRPTVVAWALNQVARAHGDAIEALVEAADRVARAQQALLEGGDAAELRSSGAARQAAAAQVLDRARRLAGTSNADALATTLDAALADPTTRAALRAGHLADTLEAPAGFGLGFDVATPTPRRTRRSSGTSSAVPSEPSAAGSRRRKAPAGAASRTAGRARKVAAADEGAAAADREARAEVARLEEALAEGDQASAATEQLLDAATAGRAEAETDLRAAEAALEEARVAVDEAEAELTRARTAAADAQRVRDRLTDALDRARARLPRGDATGRRREG